MSLIEKKIKLILQVYQYSSSLMVDLLLGSEIGLWVLEHVHTGGVVRVITYDQKIRSAAEKLGIVSLTGNANELSYRPSRIGLSVHYPRILKQPLLSQYHKVYNLHPGLLPWGRGYYPVFWALWEGTPAGPTLHEINLGIDEGPIVDQVLVEYGPEDTGWTLFKRVREAEKGLFLKHWPSIRDGALIMARPQPAGGSYHSRKEFIDLKACPNWKDWRGEELIRLIRCLSVPHYPGWEVTLGLRRFELKLQLPNSVE